MSTTALRTPYDPDRWIHIPLDYVGTPWADAAEWATWIAEEATRGRDDAAVFREPIQEQALALALFPAEHVSQRFWYFPIDGDPSGFADVYVQARVPDGTGAADLLPDPGFTAVDPVLEPVASAACPEAVRRLALPLVLASDDAEPVLYPKAEWLGIAGPWVVYMVSGDADVARLTARLEDADALFAGVDPGASE